MNSATRIALGAMACASLAAASASADFIGWTACARSVQGGYLVNVFAVVSSSSDSLLNVYGGTPGTPSAGTITSTSPGGFLQSNANGLQTWVPAAAQGWTTVDSFLTIGGSIAQDGGWISNSASVGDPPWLVTYFDTCVGANVTVNGFSTPSNPDCGFANPFLNSVPRSGGVFIAGASSPARSLAGLPNRIASSNPAAAAGAFGIMVGQFHVASISTDAVRFVNMGVTVHQGFGTPINQASFDLSVNAPPPPVDADGDGVEDPFDACPTVAGTEACDGCPANVCGTCGTAPDGDSDGVPDCQDNCPALGNPTQVDCNSNGSGDACEVASDPALDCNGNGVPDACDVASGTSTDVNSNGRPDECEADCNDNGMPDAFEIAEGDVPDCNGDGIPDTCQGAVPVLEASDDLGAPSGTEARSHTFTGLLPATDVVTLTVSLVGDLDGATEWADVTVGGLPAERLFGPDGNDCPSTPDTKTMTFAPATFNALIAASGSLTVSVECPPTVDATECKGNGSTRLVLAYLGIGANGDCDGNQRLDVCDVASGGAADCNANGIPDACDIAARVVTDCDGNGVPDACDVASGTVADCNANGIPDACDIAVGGAAVDCDANGLLDSCELATPGAAADCNANGLPDSCDIASGTSVDADGNGKPDECQTVTVPGSYATIQAAIDAAPADEMRIVQLAAGTYPGPVAFKGKPVVLRGVSAAQTAIEGNAGLPVSVVRFTGGEPGIAALERVTVRRGTTGTLLPGTSFFFGGGVFGTNSQARIRQCVVENNASAFGGGVYLLNCDTVISNTTIRANNANSDGGGLQLSQGAVDVIDTVIENNFCNARGGGAHLVQGAPILTRVTVRDNVSNNLIGGVSWYSIGAPGAALRMEACVVTGNSALVTQGGIGVSETLSLPPSMTLVGTNACANLPRPNVVGRWIDGGANVICDCMGDLFPDGRVDGADLGILLGQWGACTGSPGACVADLDGDGNVSGLDLGILIGDWGICD